jgi:hypothetical protein
VGQQAERNQDSKKAELYHRASCFPSADGVIVMVFVIGIKNTSWAQLGKHFLRPDLRAHISATASVIRTSVLRG